jgi:hypothetical protein
MFVLVRIGDVDLTDPTQCAVPVHLREDPQLQALIPRDPVRPGQIADHREFSRERSFGRLPLRVRPGADSDEKSQVGFCSGTA